MRTNETPIAFALFIVFGYTRTEVSLNFGAINRDVVGDDSFNTCFVMIQRYHLPQFRRYNVISNYVLFTITTLLIVIYLVASMLIRDFDLPCWCFAFGMALPGKEHISVVYYRIP